MRVRSDAKHTALIRMAHVRTNVHLAIGTMVSLFGLVYGETDPQDVNAMISLFTSLNRPSQLTNWNVSGGDPCTENWLGVNCSGQNVTELQLDRKGLSGSLGISLSDFQGLLLFDVSNNNIGGNIPYQLPSYVQKLNLGGNQLIGNIPYSLQQLTGLTDLDLSHNLLSNGIPDVFAPLINLKTLDLSFNSLNGSIPNSVGDLTTLTLLAVENNELNGTLPLSMSNLTNLQILNIENNGFSGWLPPGLNPPNLRTGGNHFSPSPAPPPPPFSSPPKRSPTSARTPPPPRTREPPRSPPLAGGEGHTSFWTGARVAGITVAVVLVVLAAILGLLFFLCRKRRERTTDAEKLHSGPGTWLRPLISPVLKGQSGQLISNSAELGVNSSAGEKMSPVDISKESPPKALKAPPAFKVGEKGPIRPPPSRPAPPRTKVVVPATAYSVADLQAATNSFAQENLIGEGSMGRVYRGDLPTGQVLAVKKLDTSSALVQNEEDFLKILANMARLRHANITELVGYCAEHEQRLLVYQYVGRGTLNEMLHTTEDTTKSLSWNVRVKIALGTARALEYLHEVCSPAVVHRNFKSANVLLDDELNPHLSDCGIAALTPLGSERQVSTQMLGSFGYSAPEYAMSGVYTVKSDVYSFGVVMLELLTGRRPLDSTRSRAEQSLVRWATPQLHDIDALAKMVDPALKGIYPAKSLSRFADIIASCVQPEPEFRPPMSEVVQALVRLMQRASLSKRRSGDDLGASTRSMDRHDPSDSSA